MSNKELKKKLLEAIGEKLATFGYDKKPKGQDFYRKFEDGFVCFHLSFINHITDFDITADVAVRLNQLEDLLNAQSTFLTKKEKKDTCSLGVELGNLISGKPLRWTVESESDLDKVVPSIIHTYREHGEPYLHKYSSAEEVYNFVSKDDSSVWIHSPFDADRAKSAVGLAKLLGKSEINELIKSKKKYLEEKKDFGLPDFLNFVDSLDK